MNELVNMILINLTNVGIGALLFVCMYLSNMCFSMYYNIKTIGQTFEKNRLIDGCIKAIVFVVGTALLCVGITTFPVFANYIGFEIPSDATELFSNLVILGAFLIAGIKYASEAVSKVRKILGGSVDEVPV